MSSMKSQERRNTSAVDLWNRAQVDASVRVRRMLGLSARATEYRKRRARLTRRLPHDLLVETVEEAILDTSRAG